MRFSLIAGAFVASAVFIAGPAFAQGARASSPAELARMADTRS